MYYGADRSLKEHDTAVTINRRNMAVLYSLTKLEQVELVINCIRTTRKSALTKAFKKPVRGYNELYFAPIIPERGILYKITRPLNRLILRFLNKDMIQRIESSNIINWCYWPKGFHDWEYLQFNGRIVFDADHNIIDNPNISKEYKEGRKNELLAIGKLADLIISSSRSMLNWYHSRGFHKTALMLNGIFKERINLKSQHRKEDFYTVTYCGTLSKWINLEWLLHLIHKNPDWTFNIIGQDYKTSISQDLKKFNNVRLHGFLEPKKVDAILKQTDVAIGLYNDDPALDVNSMKLYDYLCQNVPVVVNNYHDNLVEDYHNLLSTAQTLEEFLYLVENPKLLDTQELEDFLISCQWQKRIGMILQTI
ncbi:glycosyltransferase [Aegicerativicinus sediminis]|uniref:glycosyltransferase n=1 Tax=Aegicerativicinus sediminis TaxID=2893202 RepID=UPI001E383115|nr:glycosyltransferase [Aegicerativicinus sediminis]